MKIFKFDSIVNKFDKDLYNSTATLLVNDVDYYEGAWTSCGLFLNNLCNFDLINEDYGYIDVINILKDINAFGASISGFSPGTEVFTHSDSDLINSKDVVRLMLPLEHGYEYLFSGTFHLDESSSVSTIQNHIVEDDGLLFIPQKPHSYKNISDVTQYFIICDITKKELPESFWDNYIQFALKRYI